jgi:alpha-2-macroglobulin
MKLDPKSTSNLPRALAVLVPLAAITAASGVSCGGGGKAPPPIDLATLSTGPLTFPPAATELLPRRPLPPELAAAKSLSAGLGGLVSPVLDKDGKFVVNGRSIEFQFLEEAPAGAPLPKFDILPKVPGALAWRDRKTLHFTPDKPFEVGPEFSAQLYEFAFASGKKFGGFRAAFTAKPEFEVAGKIVSHIPVLGSPRPVYVRPIEEEEAKLGPDQTFIIIYDQPLELAEARRLIVAKTKQGASLPFVLAHHSADTFEGFKVDRKMVIIAKFASPPSPGVEVELQARAHVDSITPVKRTFKIASLPRFLKVECSDCRVSQGGKFVAGSAQNYGLSINYSNSFGYRRKFTEQVKVTPKPRNFVADASEGIWLHGGWEPGVTYRISVPELTDVYGYKVAPLEVTFQADQLPPHVVMRGGTIILDEAQARTFPLLARNVRRGEIHAWPIGSSDTELQSAFNEPDKTADGLGAPLVLPFDGSGKPNVYSDVSVNLLGKLKLGERYVMEAVGIEGAHGARIEDVAKKRRYRSKETSILMLAKPTDIGLNARTVNDEQNSYATFHAYRMGTGEPVPGATITYRGKQIVTDATGGAILRDPPALQREGRGRFEDLVRVENAGSVTMLSLSKSLTSSELFPGLAPRIDESEGEGRSEEKSSKDKVGFFIFDRGAYLPGSKALVKATVRKPGIGGALPVKGGEAKLIVVDPGGGETMSAVYKLSDRGTFATEIVLPQSTPTGRYHARLLIDDTRVAVGSFLVADFEPPLFKVDFAERAGAPTRLMANLQAEYFTGGVVAAGKMNWSVRKSPTDLKVGPLVEAGASFTDIRDNDYDASLRDDSAGSNTPVLGHGETTATGTFAIDADLGKMPSGPVKLSFEGEVVDSAYRSVTVKKELIRLPYARLAGIRVAQSWTNLGPLKVELGAVNAAGEPIVGASVEARLEKVTWARTATKGESGAVLESWRPVYTQVSTCSVQSKNTLTACEVKVEKNGEYRVRARIDGHDDGAVSVYAYGGASSDDEVGPSVGRKLVAETDKKYYKKGDVARVLINSPFPQATAILHLEQGRLIEQTQRKVGAGPQVFEVPIKAEYAPAVFASVTLLPLGSRQPNYRVGAVKLNVSDADVKLDVTVASSKPVYDAREPSEVVVTVTKNGKPVANADVTLAVVDEALLRATDHHVKSPMGLLFPASSLQFSITDSRDFFFRKRTKAQTPGGGSNDGVGPIDVRRDFIETLAWAPNMVTDSSGRATLQVKLKDNLTEFRMMATALDDLGGNGVSEGRFRVTRPFLLAPVLPSFAVRGDTSELAALVHNNTDGEAKAVATIAGTRLDLTLKPKSQIRVAVPWRAQASQKVLMELSVNNKVEDRVEREVVVDNPGVPELAELSSAFRKVQIVNLDIPADAIFEPGAMLTVRTGSALYPKVGKQLSTLLDYPHGCVEQTTSAMLPLLSAQVIFPWAGIEPMAEAEIRKRITAGVARLATMRTSDGGLGYWPGAQTSNLSGTVYATRALLQADAIGIREPGLLPSVLDFLGREVTGISIGEMSRIERMQIADVLALAKKLPPGLADALNADIEPPKPDASTDDAAPVATAAPSGATEDRALRKSKALSSAQRKAREAAREPGPFELASAAIALSTLPGQNDRVQKALDRLEASYDAQGAPRYEHGDWDYRYWGSSDRDRAQTLIALTKLRPNSPLRALLAKHVAGGIGSYSTQASSWNLMAFAAHVGTYESGNKDDVRVVVPGVENIKSQAVGKGGMKHLIPLQAIAGKQIAMRIESDESLPTAFMMSAPYSRPPATSTRAARRGADGPSVYRVYTDTDGKPLDLNNVKAGSVVMVALRVEGNDDYRSSFLAVTDRVPAGLQPNNGALSTSSSERELPPKHPFTTGSYEQATMPNHREMRRDRVSFYLDDRGSGAQVFMYTARAVTPGQYTVPPARGEYMYEANGQGLSDLVTMTVTP